MCKENIAIILTRDESGELGMVVISFIYTMKNNAPNMDPLQQFCSYGRDLNDVHILFTVWEITI